MRGRFIYIIINEAIIITLLLFSCFISCKPDVGKIDVEFKNEYFNNIKILEDFHRTRSKVGTTLDQEQIKSIMLALEYFEMITKLSLNVNTSDIVVWDSNKKFNADIKMLKNWFEEKKYDMTLEKSHEIIKANCLVFNLDFRNYIDIPPIE